MKANRAATSVSARPDMTLPGRRMTPKRMTMPTSENERIEKTTDAIFISCTASTAMLMPEPIIALYLPFPAGCRIKTIIKSAYTTIIS